MSIALINASEEKLSKRKDFDDLFENCDSPFDAWDSRTAKTTLMDEYIDWLMSKADWSTFLTLTFRNPIAFDTGFNLFRYLVRVLNTELFGKRYTRIVRHSYFSYLCCAEYQLRDVLHFHVLIDRPVDYTLIHDLWNRWAGFAQTKKIVNQYSAVRYAMKYALKENDVRLWIADKYYKPRQYPMWWKDIPQEII